MNTLDQIKGHVTDIEELIVEDLPDNEHREEALTLLRRIHALCVKAVAGPVRVLRSVKK